MLWANALIKQQRQMRDCLEINVLEIRSNLSEAQARVTDFKVLDGETIVTLIVKLINSALNIIVSFTHAVIA